MIFVFDFLFIFIIFFLFIFIIFFIFFFSIEQDEKKRKFDEVPDWILKKKEKRETKEKINQNKRIKSADDGISVYCVPVHTVLKWRYREEYFFL